MLTGSTSSAMYLSVCARCLCDLKVVSGVLIFLERLSISSRRGSPKVTFLELTPAK